MNHPPDVVTVKITMITASSTEPITPKPEAKELSASVPPVSPPVQQPERTTARPVIVHTTIVSKKTSKEPHRPCSTGWGVSAEAWTMGEVPQPASLE